MSTPLTKQNPIWLTKQVSMLSKSYRRSIRYYQKLYLAWPHWCAKHPGFKKIYQEAKIRREKGENVQVNHIVPICSPHLCGLHVPWNLRIISAPRNVQKSNYWWPDCWNEQQKLPLNRMKMYQYELSL